jgi:signal transduction histidine kinase
MTRKWIFALMVAVVAVVVAVFVLDLRHDRRLVFEGFVEERLAATKELASEVGARFAAVRKDVLFFKYLAENSALAEATSEVFHSQVGSRFQRELRAMLEVVPHYKEMEIIGPNGGVALSAREPRWNPGPDAENVQRALAAAALIAPSLPEGRVQVSAPIQRVTGKHDTPGYRILSASVHLAGGRGAVLLLIEPDYLFGALRAFHAPDKPRFALINIDAVRVGYMSDPKLKALDLEFHGPTGPSQLGTALLGHETGRAELSRESAQRLGLGPFAVATFSRLPHTQNWRWTLTAFSSAEHLEARDQAVLLRTVVAMAAVLAGLTALGALLLRQVRRETELSAKLRSANEIRHLHELSEKILNNVPSGLLALGNEMRILQANGAIQAMSPAARPGLALSEAFPAASSPVMEEVGALVREALGKKETCTVLLERVKLLSDKPGTYRVLAVPLETPLHDVEVLLMIEDLSELKRLELELVRAEKLSTIGILAAGIAHEVGTPLGVIRARAEHLLDKAADRETRSLQTIVEQCDNISRIIRQVLEFSRRREVEVAPVPAGAALREAGELLRERFEKAGVHLDVFVPADLPDLLADADGLRQVLLNLLRNACDACSTGGRVEARAAPLVQKGVRYLRVEVRDDGCGIRPEHLHAIFDPFFTTKKGGEGVGLGLAIAQDVVKNHGGTLSVESVSGKGSIFTLVWPAVRDPATAEKGLAANAAEEGA